MNYNEINDAKRYLFRFNQILSQMANKMFSAKIVRNITLDFIKCMIPHHQAAIYMCENLLEYTTYPPLQLIARDIINAQTKGIEQMEEIAKTTQGYESYLCDVRRYYNTYLQITRTMVYEMRNSKKSYNINLDFTNEMIPHHEGAIRMCNNLLQYRIDPRLKDVALDIIQEQTEGIEELKEIRKKLSSNK